MTATSMFMSARRTLRATRAPAFWQTRATARSKGSVREASTPELAHAARWSPSGSRHPRQAHARGATGRGSRNQRRRTIRNCGEGRVSSDEVGKTVSARAACGPACDSSSARDAASVRKMQLERVHVTGGRGQPLPPSHWVPEFPICMGSLIGLYGPPVRCCIPLAAEAGCRMLQQRAPGSRDGRLASPAPSARRYQARARGWREGCQPRRPNRLLARSRRPTVGRVRQSEGEGGESAWPVRARVGLAPETKGWPDRRRSPEEVHSWGSLLGVHLR